MSSDNSHDNNGVGPSTDLSNRIAKGIGNLLGGSADQAPTTDLGVEQLAHLAKNERRRALLFALEDAETATLRKLARQVAQATAGSLSQDDYQRAYIALYQTHLPKLEAADVVFKLTEEDVAADERWALSAEGEAVIAAGRALEQIAHGGASA